ncbi:MAG: N-acetylneuraminate synthase [Candidatus Muiribacterium halophilum]|uniref:N-acetylneuraminate synthase n=1 Tax=Muiribacterium halophilum TaxID=2053465 RepID=A0A2N5Z9Z7_MUIH1|nr:MAG: N-acetylneuraminate synthase [Candidatus Muirbacterium halophilum]
MSKVKVIAEIGCNHRGEMETAFELIKIAKDFCKADIVKFQKRTPKELLSEEEYNAPHPNPANSYGETYGLHREFLEFDLKQNKRLKEFCEKLGIIYSTSVWDLTSTKEIVSLNPQLIKIPSAANLKFDIHKYLCENYNGEIHISFGMTTQAEEEEIVSFYEKHDKAKNLVVYSCTSGYPVPFEDICLLEIKRIKDKFQSRVKEIGFSGHHLGIAVDVCALTLGARYIERHFTLDRTWKGTDHAASLEPDGMRKLVRDLQNCEKALAYKEKEILPIEQVQRDKLKRVLR